MHIGEKKLAHLIEKTNPADNTIVVMDETTGEEVELTKEEFLRLLASANFFFNLPAPVSSLFL